MSYNPQIHHRRSIRLKGYDYSRAGIYFITICVNDRKRLFGNIADGEMVLNDAGKIANESWLHIPVHFPNAVLHEHIIMPNHVHGIIELRNVGANKYSPINDNTEQTVRAKNLSPGNNKANIYSPQPPGNNRADIYSPQRRRTPFKSPSRTIGSIIRGYKIGVTKWFRQNTEIRTLWQRDYYEHIIRNEESYQNIANYIINNPAKWKDDKFYKS
ncbi:MAG: transposase [Bacteroidia bacterium]